MNIWTRIILFWLTGGIIQLVLIPKYYYKRMLELDEVIDLGVNGGGWAIGIVVFFAFITSWFYVPRGVIRKVTIWYYVFKYKLSYKDAVIKRWKESDEKQ